MDVLIFLLDCLQELIQPPFIHFADLVTELSLNILWVRDVFALCFQVPVVEGGQFLVLEGFFSEHVG